MYSNGTPDDGLDIRDELAIAAKLEGKADYEAAEVAGYSARTSSGVSTIRFSRNVWRRCVAIA